MGHKKKGISQGIGAAFQVVGKLLGGGAAKEAHLQDGFSKIAPVPQTGMNPCRSEELEAQESVSVAPGIEESFVTNDLPSVSQPTAEENASSAAVEEEPSSDPDVGVACEESLMYEGRGSDNDASRQDDSAPEIPALNYEFSNDCRNLLMRQCRQAADNCADALHSREISDQTPAQISGEAQPFLFDIVNCRVSDFSGSGASTQMPIFCCMDDKEPCLCHPHGIYTQTLVDCYELFHDEREETRHLRHSILRRSLDVIIGSTMPAVGCHFMCLIPDIVDEFDRVFREQLNYGGTPLFQVPRSIALAYTLQEEGWALPDEFLCLDYDGEDFFAIKLCNVADKNGDNIFIRMGREKVPGEHLSSRELSNEYLRQYQKKHGLRFSESAVSNLVNTKRLQHLLFEKTRYLLFDNDGVLTPLYADTEILDGKIMFFDKVH